MSVDILCLGEAMGEFSRGADGRWTEGIGGDVSNTAIAARRQGASTGMATLLGTDSFGDSLLARWTAEKVDTAAVARIDRAPTGLYFVSHGPEGHRFEYRRAGSAASLLSPDSLPREAIRSARLLHLSGISQAISKSAAQAGFAAMQEARAAGTRISYDPNLRLALWPLDKARAVIHEAMHDIDIALPGLEDARQLTGLQAPEEILAFYRARGAAVVALTLGADGAMVAFGDSVLRIPPHPARLVDAVGAGDCFDGAFLAEWLATGHPGYAGRYATVAAALSVQGSGALGAVPTRAEVERAMAGRPADAATAAKARSGPRLALVAHDARKDRLVAWAERHRETLRHCAITATGSTGGRLAKALPELSIRSLKSGPLGGDQQIGALIAEGALDALVFFIDPLSPMPHDVDVKALTRLATVYDLPMACSERPADMVIAQLAGDLAAGSAGTERR